MESEADTAATHNAILIIDSLRMGVNPYLHALTPKNRDATLPASKGHRPQGQRAPQLLCGSRVTVVWTIFELAPPYRMRDRSTHTPLGSNTTKKLGG